MGALSGTLDIASDRGHGVACGAETADNISTATNAAPNGCLESLIVVSPLRLEVDLSREIRPNYFLRIIKNDSSAEAGSAVRGAGYSKLPGIVSASDICLRAPANK